MNEAPISIFACVSCGNDYDDDTTLTERRKAQEWGFCGVPCMDAVLGKECGSTVRTSDLTAALSAMIAPSKREG